MSNAAKNLIFWYFSN